MLNISIDKVEDFDDVEFIDEVAEMLKWDTAHGQEGVEYDISPEMEYLLIGLTSFSTKNK